MTFELELDSNRWKNDFYKGVSSALKSKRRVSGTFLAGALTLFFTVLSSHPEYSFQMLSSGLRNWPVAFISRFYGLIVTSGYEGAVLTVFFSGLVGVTVVNTFTQLGMNKISFDSLGAVPGFLAGGCASCGVGLLSMLGLGGILASLPFQGNLLRLGGVLILVLLVIRTGDPEECEL